MRGKAWTGLQALEWVLLVVGATCVGWYAGQTAAIRRFEAQDRAAVERMLADRVAPASEFAPDADASWLIGRLEIPRLHVSATVERGDDEGVLQAAVGYLADTPPPWRDGNSVLAAHRDSIFRPLQHIRIGDEIRLDTPRGTFRYRVRRTMVVEPKDVWVLGQRSHVDLTLITCFPFVYVGHAPQRFVVQAEKIPVETQ